MSDDRRRDPVQSLLGLIAQHLEAWQEGDELALEGLGETLQANEFAEEHLLAAIATLRSLAGALPGPGVVAFDEAPGRGAQRVLSPLERESLSPEAWGFLIALRKRGSLDAGQFERVLDRLTTIGVRPIGVELAGEVAARVALRGVGRSDAFAPGAGDGEPSH
jgi:uncharacterized protein Smg (DUF494 family)